MVTVTTSLFTNSPVNIADDSLVRFHDKLIGTSKEFSWLASFDSSNAVFIHGSKLTYSGSGDARELSGGVISSIVIDSGNDNGSKTNGDLIITGTEGLDVTQIKKGDAQSFWGEILKGDDTFNLIGLNETDVGFGTSVVFGDDLRCVSTNISKTDQGGNDHMFGADNELLMIGDVSLVFGATGGSFIIPATYTGGNDEISGAASDRRNNLIGDASVVSNFGELIGGDDRIDGSRNSNSSTSITGDVDNLQQDGFAHGGNDSISFGSAGVGGGDVLFMLGANVVAIGGNDTIDGIVLKCAGDVYDVVSTTINGRIDGGDDRIVGGDAEDRISGDILLRHSDRNTVTGGDDLLSGGDGNDHLFGEVADGALKDVSGGNDRLFGGKGDDELSGQTGNDRLIGGAGADSLDGGAGIDLAAYDSSASGVIVSLAAGVGLAGDAMGDVLDGVERLLGSGFADTLIGDQLANVLMGGDGADVVNGRGGHDSLFGGGQADRFVFNVLADSKVGQQHDFINDFSKAELDKIDVSAIDASAAGAGNNAFTQFIGSAAFSAEGQIRAVKVGGNTIVEFNTSGASGADMQILLTDFTAAATLKLTDFVV